MSEWGFTTHGLGTWQRHELTKGQETLSVEAVPAVHARGLKGRLLPPVMGSVLEHRVDGRVRRRLYLTGDTLTGDHVDAIRERHPDLDATVVHLGGTRVLLHTVTMDADQGVDFLRRLRPGRAIAVHHDDYGVFRSPVSAWVQLAAEAGFGEATYVPERGETVPLGE
jgi:L-ascorbate metabolism protein UlaG (beta-lactamase superfamily)